MFAGADEDGEPAERRLSSQSRDAARSPEAFGEAAVCLPGSQGNRTHSSGNWVTTVFVTVVVDIDVCSPSQDSPCFPASDWAVAVCRHFGGGAGGSALVAKGTGNASDIGEGLRWAEQFALQQRPKQ